MYTIYLFCVNGIIQRKVTIYFRDFLWKTTSPRDQKLCTFVLEMFYLNSTLNFGIPPVLLFQLEVYYVVDRLLTGPTAQQKGTTARWYSNKTFLLNDSLK